MRTLIAALAALPLTACCLAPNTVRTDVTHMSHVSQHFGSNTTNYGTQIIGATAQWRTQSGWFAELGEHYNIGKSGSYHSWTDAGGQLEWTDSRSCPGSICGPREITTVSVGYIWQVRK